jgi:hypothetical protein
LRYFPLYTKTSNQTHCVFIPLLLGGGQRRRQRPLGRRPGRGRRPTSRNTAAISTSSRPLRLASSSAAFAACRRGRQRTRPRSPLRGQPGVLGRLLDQRRVHRSRGGIPGRQRLGQVDLGPQWVLGTRTSAASPSFLLGPGQPHNQDCPPLTAPSGPLAAVAAFWPTEENTIG